jgi:hypothetical protein
MKNFYILPWGDLQHGVSSEKSQAEMCRVSHHFSKKAEGATGRHAGLLTFFKWKDSRTLMAQACNPSYLGG